MNPPHGGPISIAGVLREKPAEQDEFLLQLNVDDRVIIFQYSTRDDEYEAAKKVVHDNGLTQDAIHPIRAWIWIKTGGKVLATFEIVSPDFPPQQDLSVSLDDASAIEIDGQSMNGTSCNEDEADPKSKKGLERGRKGEWSLNRRTVTRSMVRQTTE